jgi:hypothetical protein
VCVSKVFTPTPAAAAGRMTDWYLVFQLSGKLVTNTFIHIPACLASTGKLADDEANIYD